MTTPKLNGFYPWAANLQDLRPKGQFKPSQHKQEFQINCHALTSWHEVFLAIQQICQHSQMNNTKIPGFYIGQWNLDSLYPPALVVKQFHQLMDSLQLSDLDLFLDHQIELTPEVYSFKTSADEIQNQANIFWATAEAQDFLNAFLQMQPERQALYDGLIKLQANQSPDWYSTIHELFQERDLFSDFSEETQSGLWRDIQQLYSDLFKASLQHSWSEFIRPACLAHNPVFTVLTHLNSPKTGSIYSIGAGQMIATLDLSRQLIDDGILPLTTPLLADNRSNDAVLELHCTGQRKSILGDLWVNPEDRKPIAVHSETLRQELMSKYKPEIIFLNVKAQALTAIFNEDFCQFLASLYPLPILVMPSKSYTLAGQTPYQKLFGILKKYNENLAMKLTVLGGFYAAPSILTGDLVHMTVASQDSQAALDVASKLCKKDCLVNGDTVKDGSVHIEVQSGPVAAAMLMAGGANKNYLTYTAARDLLRFAFAQDHTQLEEWLKLIDEQIHLKRQHNVEYSQTLTSKLLELKTPLTPASAGLVTDFVHCLPLTGRGICALVEQSYRIQKHILRTPPRSRAQEAKTQLQQLIEEVRQDSQRLLGTRNARDGFIDELISYFHETWLTHKSRLPLAPLEPAVFYAEFYPEEWQGDSAQEGRNGILPVIVKASLLQGNKAEAADWYQDLVKIWHSYFPIEEAQPAEHTSSAANPDQKWIHWHKQLHHLLTWASEQDQRQLPVVQQKIKEWIAATRIHKLDTEPDILNHLDKNLDSLNTLSLKDFMHL